MIRVKLGNRTLGVTFQREFIPALIRETLKGRMSEDAPQVRATYCELHRLDDNGQSEAIVARSRARCARQDNFSFEAGRKLSLARALKQYGLTRDERSRVWSIYLDRPRPVSRPKVKVQPPLILEGSPAGMGAGDHADGYREPAQVHAQLDLNAGEV